MSGFPIFPFLILMMVVSWIIQWRLRSKMSKYAQVGLQAGLSGRQIAELMLADHGITDVRVSQIDDDEAETAPSPSFPMTTNRRSR